MAANKEEIRVGAAPEPRTALQAAGNTGSTVSAQEHKHSGVFLLYGSLRDFLWIFTPVLFSSFCFMTEMIKVALISSMAALS